ncbi:sporulation protein [Neobacillus sp. C211]|uniref:sporulation protein n=1 Tax=unclassified Neobacillus TaxID=2675272 RepID=UPI00397BEA54
MVKVKVLFLLFVLLMLASCSKVDNIRDPISIKSVDLEYLATSLLATDIDSLVIYAEDTVIGDKVYLQNDDDYDWFFEMLLENKTELFEEKKPNSHLVKIRFSEENWSIDYDPGKYNGKKVSFYISNKLRNDIIKMYKMKHPVSTILKNTIVDNNGNLEGYTTISSSNRKLVLEEITLALYSSEEDSPLETWEIAKKVVIEPKTEKRFPFKIKLPAGTPTSDSQKSIFLNTEVKPIELYIDDQDEIKIVE